MEEPDNIRRVLARMTGTLQYWSVFHGNESMKITDGVKTMADLCCAHWLTVTIWTLQALENVRKEPFQVWTLEICNIKGRSNDAILIAEDGNGNEIIRQNIEYTDFPLYEGIKLYLDGDVLMLPSEY